MSFTAPRLPEIEFDRLRPPTRLIVALGTALLALSSCGDGGGALLTPPDDDDDPPSDCTPTSCGEVRIALTDGNGDFLSYAVDLVSIRLERANGDDVQVLPTRQRVDFVELADVSEFVLAEDVPNGNYERAFVRLDLSDAEVNVEVDGLPAPSEVVDPNGDAVGIAEVEIVFDELHPLVVASATPALLQLDFDLEASHEVNLGTTPATVTAAPFLVASLVPRDTREFRVRGPLVSVDEAAESYVVNLRPFDHRTAELGEFTVLTTDDTACEVDGDELEGADCIAALADLADDTLTVAHGAYSRTTRRFTAARVLAGSSVPGAEFDTVTGVVAARNGNTLVMQGGTLVRADGGTVYAGGDITVTLGSDTDVTRDGGSPQPLDIGDLSVGQRIQAFGEASSSDVTPTLDARGARVRQLATGLTGTVNSAITDEVRLFLFSIDGRDPQFFDFDGTGTSLITEADPDNYQLDTSALNVGQLDDDEGIAAVGFVAPFGTAPPDFEATALTDFEALPALLGVGWGFNGTDAPFLSMGQNGFVIDITNVDLGERQFLQIGPRRFDITSGLPEPITVEPAETNRVLFAVAQGAEVQVFSDFGDFVARVNNLLNGGNAMRSFTARGTFDEPTTTVTAGYVAISFR